MKKFYEKPSLRIEKFDVKDIITTSDILLGTEVPGLSGMVFESGVNTLESIDYRQFKK